MKLDVNSKYYPYIKAMEGDFNFEQYAQFPRMLCDYLLDAPKGAYTPKDDNSYPRCRFWKYLFYDGAKPLNETLPTITQKMSVLFNPDKPTEPPTDKGYRLIPQEYIKQAQDSAQTRIYCYMGRAMAQSNNKVFSASVVFDIFTNYTYELNTKQDEYSRSGAIVAAIVEALNGVNITGIGTFSMSKAVHPDCIVRPIYDGSNSVGQQLIIGLEMATTSVQGAFDTTNMPFIDETNNIRML